MPLQPGQMLSHYRLIEKIGAGGMGVVWKAEDQKLRRILALKTLRPELVGDETSQRRFIREARAAAGINHPNIATIHEIGEAAGVTFIAMEYVEGKTLRSLLQERPLPIPEALRHGTAMARGLAEAHKAGVIHRDLKPENVIIGTELQVKILDFGLAKLVEGREEASRSQMSQAPTMTGELTREHTILGTLHYMSPEQVKGQQVDARSDLFSFGVMLHEMVTGQRPFRGATPFEVRDSITHHQVAPASRQNRDIPPDLDRLLGKCLQKEPEKRYQDSGELVEALEAIKLRPRWRWATRTALAFLPVLFLAVALESMEMIHLVPDWPPPAPVPSPIVDSNTVAVFPFSVRGSDTIDHMSDGMVDLLGSMLNAGEVRSVDSYALLAALRQDEDRGAIHGPPDPGRARRLAAEFGAGRFILGTIVQTGNVLNVQASLYDTSGNGEPLLQARARAPEDRILAAVDKIAIRILEIYVSDPEPGTLTDNFEALKAYLQGQKLYRQGSYTEAQKAYQLAIEKDPSFALAYYRMALASYWGVETSVKGPLEEALEHCNKLPARYCRLAEAYMAARVHGDAEEGIRLAQSFITRYPDEVDAWFLLGQTRFFYDAKRAASLDEARKALERALQFDPEHFPTLVQLWWLAGLEERYEDVAKLVRRIYPLHAELEPLWAVYVACTEGDETSIKQAIDVLARELPATFMSTAAGSLASIHHDLDCAEMVARKLVESSPAPEGRAVGYGRLAIIHLMRGQWSNAKANLDEMQRIDDSAQVAGQRASFYLSPFVPVARAALETLREELSRLIDASAEDRIYLDYILGHLNARLDDPATALQYAEDLMAMSKALREDGRTDKSTVAFGQVFSGLAELNARRFAHSVRAQVAWERGNPADGLLEIEKIHPEEFWLYPLVPDVLERYFRAMLLEDAGRDEEALRWYRSIGYNSGPGVSVYRAPMHFWIGKIHERRGDREKAIAHYSRFVDLWRDCDPELQPLVEDAERRMTRLRGSIG